MQRVIIYTLNWCGYCHAAKSLLNSREISFEELDVTNDPETRSAASRRAGGYRQLPAIFIDENFIGGYRELKALDAKGELEPLMP